MAGGGRGLLDDAGRLPGGGQVGGDVDEPGGADQVGADGGHDGVDVVGAPGLGGVVRAVVVGDDARPVVAGAAGDGVADADAAADSRHQDGAPRQGQGVAADGADRSGGAGGAAGVAQSGGGASVMSVGGHADECRRTVHASGDFFLRPGTFHAGECRCLRAGTVRASGDRIPVPRRVRRPWPSWVVPGRNGTSPTASLVPVSSRRGGQKPVQRRGRREDPDGSAPQSSVRASSRAKASWLPREDRTKRMSPRRPTASGSVWASCSTARAAATAISATRAICHP